MFIARVKRYKSYLLKDKKKYKKLALQFILKFAINISVLTKNRGDVHWTSWKTFPNDEF